MYLDESKLMILGERIFDYKKRKSFQGLLWWLLTYFTHMTQLCFICKISKNCLPSPTQILDPLFIRQRFIIYLLVKFWLTYSISHVHIDKILDIKNENFVVRHQRKNDIATIIHSVRNLLPVQICTNLTFRFYRIINTQLNNNTFLFPQRKTCT